jgi:hypothetical protein
VKLRRSGRKDAFWRYRQERPSLHGARLGGDHPVERRQPASFGQPVRPADVSETLFALFYSFAWDGRWPNLAQSAACVLFTLGILASIKAHR